VETDYLNRSVKAQMREANKMNAKFVLLIGGDEYERGKIVLKNMMNSEQEEITKNNLESVIQKVKENNCH
jgi:histidyl-tRNA synthetase